MENDEESDQFIPSSATQLLKFEDPNKLDDYVSRPRLPPLCMSRREKGIMLSKSLEHYFPNKSKFEHDDRCNQIFNEMIAHADVRQKLKENHLPSRVELLEGP